MKMQEISFVKTASRLACLIAVLIGFSDVTKAQDHGGRTVRQKPVKLDVHYPPGISVVEVPFRSEAGKILVDVSVNGSDPLEFVLDTGAPFAVLLGLEKIEGTAVDIYGESQIWGAGSSGTKQVTKLAQGVRLDLGQLRLEGAIMDIMPTDGVKFLEALSWDGIFGGQLFMSVVVEINWEKRLLRLHDPSTFEAPTGSVAVPLNQRHGYIFVPGEVTIDGQSQAVELVVDIGGAHALTLSPDRVPLPAHRLEDAVLGRGLSGLLKGDYGRIDQLRFGGSSLEDVVTDFPDASSLGVTVGSDGSIGTELLRRFVVTFDYARSRMLLLPTEAITEPFLFPTSGMKLESWIDTDGAVVISDIYADSPAERAGLAAGDRIVAVNSQPVADLGIDAIRDLFRQPPGTRVLLQVRHADSVREVELILDTVL